MSQLLSVLICGEQLFFNKHPTRTNQRQVSVKTSLRIMLMLSPKVNVVISYWMWHKSRHLVFWHHLCSACVPCPFQIVFTLSFLRGVYLAQRESQCKYRQSKGLMFTKSKYSGGISFNGQIFKLVLTLFDHFREHNILKLHLLVMRRQEKKSKQCFPCGNFYMWLGTCIWIQCTQILIEDYTYT